VATMTAVVAPAVAYARLDKAKEHCIVTYFQIHLNDSGRKRNSTEAIVL
jgi:hypothetical protein